MSRVAWSAAGVVETSQRCRIDEYDEREQSKENRDDSLKSHVLCTFFVAHGNMERRRIV